MKERILTGWTFSRVLFLVMGTIVIMQSVMEKQWMGVALGGYFAAMGLFSFGCAAGGCMGDSCNTTPQSKSKTTIKE